MKKNKYQKIFVILVCCLPRLSCGGTLGDFEHDSTTSTKDEKSHKSESSHKHEEHSDKKDNSACTDENCGDSDESIGDDIFDSFFGPIFDPMFSAIYDSTFGAMFKETAKFFSHGTAVTLARTGDSETVPGIRHRKTGSPLLPTFRVRGAWQSVYPDVQGRDFSVEAGYSLFSVQYRHTTYVESHSRDNLALSYGLLSYRLSYGNRLELDLGYGYAWMKGNKSTTGYTFSAPIVWKFADHFAFRFWQAYTTLNSVPLTDLDFSAMYVNQGFSALVGYRSVTNPVSALSGPYIGVSYYY